FLRKIAKLVHRLICFIVYFSGLYHTISFLKRSKAVIVMYHSVDDGSNPYVYPDNVVSAENFESQMEYLSRKKNVISLSELVRDLSSGSDLPRNAAVITFDDGYHSFYSTAHPILRRYGVPSTLFLITGLLGTCEAKWDDRLAGAINTTPSRLVTVNLSGKERTYDLRSQKAKRDCIVELVGILQNLNTEDRSKTLLRIERQLNSRGPEPERVTLTWDEVSELAEDSLVSLGSHSHSHENLRRIGPQLAEWEISKSKEEMEHKLGRSCRLFCYPFGKKSSLDEHVKRLLRSHGFLAAVSTIPGSASKGSDLLELRRIAARDDSSYRFKCSLIGLTLQRG
ncbi:MAG: polysaccharide deacetylase family protein, partial [bacterium]